MKRLLIFTALSVSTMLSAQVDYSVTKDFGLWTSAEFRYALSEDLKVSMGQNLRFQDNAQTFDQYFTELGLKYSPTKHFYAGAAYRLGHAFDLRDSVQTGKSRWQVEMGSKHKVDRLSISSRLRYQNRRNFVDPVGVRRTGVRVKGELGYNIPDWKWDPSIAAEAFVDVPQTQLYKYRLTAGISDDIAKGVELGLALRYERELTSKNRIYATIFAVDLTVDLNKK